MILIEYDVLKLILRNSNKVLFSKITVLYIFQINLKHTCLQQELDQIQMRILEIILM